MTKEIINIEELAQLAAVTPYEAGHAPLLEAMRHRYPSSIFNLVSSDTDPWRKPGVKVIDRDGNYIIEDYKQWVTAEVHAAGGNASAVYEKYKDSGLRVTESEGVTAVVVVPYGSEPDAFIQIELQAVREKAELLLFGHWFPPQELQDLLHPSEYGEETELSPWAYRVGKLINVRRFLKEMAIIDRSKRLAKLPEMEKKVLRVLKLEGSDPILTEIPFLDMFPDWLQLPMPELRFFLDWQESSAGSSGASLCDHWWLNAKDYTYEGERHLSFIPCWAGVDGERVPRIEADIGSIYGLMDALEDFDRIAGYPFAWYFYMLHGNKLNRQIGERVVEAIRSGKIGLPIQDEKVLLRWADRQYGF